MYNNNNNNGARVGFSPYNYAAVKNRSLYYVYTKDKPPYVRVKKKKEPTQKYT